MNVFFLFNDGQLVTPPLGGTILPGITRASIIELARDIGLTVDEQPYAFETWRDDAASGRLREVFACGTAAVVAAIGEVRHAGGTFRVADGGEGATTRRLRDRLVGLQRGGEPDDRGWLHRIAPAAAAR